MPKHTTTFRGTCTAVERLRNSYVGNPNYRLTILTEQGPLTFRTKDDIADGYSISPAWEGKEVILTLEGQKIQFAEVAP